MKASEVYSNQKQILKDFFNSTSEQWDNLYSGDSFIDVHMCERKEIVLSIVDEIATNKKLRVLDLGCGSGILSKELIKKGHTVVCADIAIDLLYLLDQSVRKKNNDNYIGSAIADAANICLSDKSFDIVLCIGVLQYQINDNLVLKEINRVLKVDGVCIITFPNLLRLNYLFDPYYHIKYIYRVISKLLVSVFFKGSESSIIKGLSGRLNVSRPYDKKYFLKDIKALLLQNNFKINNFVAFGFGPFTLFNQQIFNDTRSLLLSFKIKRWSNNSRSRFLNLTANRWIFISQRSYKINSGGDLSL